MRALTNLQVALLELGLEDLIPLPEAITTPEVLAQINSDGPSGEVASALVDLLRKELVQVWTGQWRAAPRLVSMAVAEELLLDEGAYSFDSETMGRERVYFVNVENYRE